MLLIAEQNQKDFTKGTVCYADKLKNVEVMIDVSNPRAMIIASRDKVIF